MSPRWKFADDIATASMCVLFSRWIVNASGGPIVSAGIKGYHSSKQQCFTPGRRAGANLRKEEQRLRVNSKGGRYEFRWPRISAVWAHFKLKLDAFPRNGSNSRRSAASVADEACTGRPN